MRIAIPTIITALEIPICGVFVSRKRCRFCRAKTPAGEYLKQRTLTDRCWGKDHCTAALQFYKFGLNWITHYIRITTHFILLFKSRLVKLETSCTVILLPTTVGDCLLLQTILNDICHPHRDLLLVFALSFSMAISVTSKKLPNVDQSCPKLISLVKLKILTPLQKLPKNVRDLAN